MIRLVLSAAVLATPAAAHMAASGWAYDAACCSNQDCSQIDASRVQATPEGHVVTLRPGDHPLVTREVTATYRYPDALPGSQWDGNVREAHQSGDEHFHACVGPNTGNLLCLYVPELGT